MLPDMDDARLGRSIVVLRQRRGWRQQDLADRARVSQSAISDIERGRVDRYTLATTRRILRALDATASIGVLWSGRGELDRLLDADHAALLGRWAELHRSNRWETWTEASYSVYGERGRIDLLAFHPPSGTLEVVEAKTGLWDLQETLGRLDAKVRLAPQVAAERAWKPRRIVGCLVIADSRTARRRVAEHAALLGAYETRGRGALAFVRHPTARVTGALVFVSLGAIRAGRAGQRRVRRSSAPGDG